LISQFRELSRIITSKQRFLISCHINPDGDGIGSLLALGTSLKELGKDVQLVCTDGVPNVYGFLDGSTAITRNWEFSKPSEKPIRKPPEVLVLVDCAEKERVALPTGVWNTAGLTIVNIDHHVTNAGFGDLNIIDSNAAATGEIIFHILKELNLPFNQSIALALYTAIATDTGFFRFANTSGATLEACSYLINAFHIEPAKIAEQVHEQKSYNSIRLLGEVLNTIKLTKDGKVAWAVLDQQMLAKYPVEYEETENYVNYARSIEGVEIGILFKELKLNEIKLSWRSTSAVDVSKLAAYFGGGGHARAAGCNINGSLPEVVDHVLRFVAKFYGVNYVAWNPSNQ
jgi:phosphoesterase RecJ-like protein